MPCDAVGLLRNVEMGPEIKIYLESIDGTPALFGGRFIIQRCSHRCCGSRGRGGSPTSSFKLNGAEKLCGPVRPPNALFIADRMSFIIITPSLGFLDCRPDCPDV